jgi:hypothetical protein
MARICFWKLFHVLFYGEYEILFSATCFDVLESQYTGSKQPSALQSSGWKQHSAPQSTGWIQ